MRGVRGAGCVECPEFIVPGTHTLKVRATDEQGYVQTAPTRGGANDVYPNGNAKIHEIVVKVP